MNSKHTEFLFEPSNFRHNKYVSGDQGNISKAKDTWGKFCSNGCVIGRAYYEIFYFFEGITFGGFFFINVIFVDT